MRKPLAGAYKGIPGPLIPRTGTPITVAIARCHAPKLGPLRDRGRCGRDGAFEAACHRLQQSIPEFRNFDIALRISHQRTRHLVEQRFSHLNAPTYVEHPLDFDANQAAAHLWKLAAPNSLDMCYP